MKYQKKKEKQLLQKGGNIPIFQFPNKELSFLTAKQKDLPEEVIIPEGLRTNEIILNSIADTKVIKPKQTFSQAFAAAREAGLDKFYWEDPTGKNSGWKGTKLAGEVTSKKEKNKSETKETKKAIKSFAVNTSNKPYSDDFIQMQSWIRTDSKANSIPDQYIPFQKFSSNNEYKLFQRSISSNPYQEYDDDNRVKDKLPESFGEWVSDFDPLEGSRVPGRPTRSQPDRAKTLAEKASIIWADIYGRGLPSKEAQLKLEKEKDFYRRQNESYLAMRKLMRKKKNK